MKGQDRPDKEERERDDRGGPRADPVAQKAEADHGYRPYGPRQTHDDSGAYALAFGQDLLRQHDDGRHQRQVEQSCDSGKHEHQWRPGGEPERKQMSRKGQGRQAGEEIPAVHPVREYAPHDRSDRLAGQIGAQHHGAGRFRDAVLKRDDR